MSVGRVQAGDWASSVPDLLVAEGRYGIALGEDPVAARAAFDHRFAPAADALVGLDLQEQPARRGLVGGEADDLHAAWSSHACRNARACVRVASIDWPGL